MHIPSTKGARLRGDEDVLRMQTRSSCRGETYGISVWAPMRRSMSRLATRRLIDAAASLEAADRALLNIWMSRGLDDADLARMTGMTEATIAGRRERIVAQLSTVLE